MTLLDSLVGEDEQTIKAVCWARLSEIRRAIAIAQAVMEHPDYWTFDFTKENIMRRADELLAPKRIAPGFIGALERREGKK